MVLLSAGPEDFSQPAQPSWITPAIAGLQGAQAIEIIAATKGRATLDQPLEQTQQRQSRGTRWLGRAGHPGASESLGRFQVSRSRCNFSRMAWSAGRSSLAETLV